MKKYNTTPMAYQLQLKVAEAKRCLAKGMDVFEICNRIGFYDQAHFIREFHKMHGLSPNAYIKKLDAGIQDICNFVQYMKKDLEFTVPSLLFPS